MTQPTLELKDTALIDLRPLPMERKNSRHYEELWRAIKYRMAATGQSLEVACPADRRVLMTRGVRKRKVLDTDYRAAHPRTVLRCEDTEKGVLFTLFHPVEM